MNYGTILGLHQRSWFP